MMTLDLTAQLAPAVWGLLAVLLAAVAGILTCIDRAELGVRKSEPVLRRARRPVLAGIVGRVLPRALAGRFGGKPVPAAG
jgi:hypothetical protein